jgi:hypothetical protein
MKNLARRFDEEDDATGIIAECDLQVKIELELARIPVHQTTLIMKPDLNTETLKEGSRWVRRLEFAQGPPIGRSEVPTKYYGQIGKWTFVRFWYYWVVRGNGREMPLEKAWEIYQNPIGKQDVRAFGDCGCVEPTWNGNKSVDVYHVDSQEGLNLLARYVFDYERWLEITAAHSCGPLGCRKIYKDGTTQFVTRNLFDDLR